MTSASKAFACLAAALAFAASAAGELAVPPLAARVTDQTATLKPGERDALEAKLAAFEAKKGSQVAVLIVPSTQPEAIEQYSIRVADAWKLGRKGVDDGVLLLVAKDDRRLRIEVGRGLEGVIPDAAARRIIAEYITPRFKQGDYYGGILAGVDRVLGAIEGEPLPVPGERSPLAGLGLDSFDTLFFAVIAFFVAQGFLQRIFGRFGGAALTGGAAGLLIFLLWQAVFIAVIASIVIFVLSLMMGQGASQFWSPRRGGGWGSGGGWSSGGGGGGGFSGGGGGFSGGGSSGSW